MILNHRAAIELLVDEADRIGFDVLTFQSLHAALAANLLGDPADEGRLPRESLRFRAPLAVRWESRSQSNSTSASCSRRRRRYPIHSSRRSS